MEGDLNRFVEAQNEHYAQALSEIKSGGKKSHWMWYVFPQLKGLGYSETSKFYAIANSVEAKDYLEHPVLGKRLREITEELLSLQENDPQKIMGSPDHLKLRSSMTLFSSVNAADENLFEHVLNKFYRGEKDQKTLDLLKK